MIQPGKHRIASVDRDLFRRGRRSFDRQLPTLAVAIGLLLATGCGIDANGSKAFRALLAESGMEFRAAPGLRAIEPVDNQLFAVEHALRHREVNLEIRYAIRPIERLEIEYDDPHSAAPHPNDLYPMLFDSVQRRVSGRGSSPQEVLPADQAHEEFGADWAAIAVLETREGFGESFKHCMLLALHRNDLADAYAFFLFDDKEAAMPVIRESLHSLRFSVSPETAADVSGVQG